MTKLTAKLLNVTVLTILSTGALFSSIAQAETYSVSVTAIVDHPALNSIRDGVKDQLALEGFEEGKNLKWDYQSAQGNVGTAAQIARNFVGNNPNVIVPIATPSAQAVASVTKDIPIVFSGITDPVAAQLVKSLDANGTNITGVTDELDINKQIELIQKIVPEAKTVGIVFNPGEANSAGVVNKMRELLPNYGMTLIDVAAPRSVDVGPAAQSLVGKVDVIYTSTDNNVVSAYESLVKIGNQMDLPLIAADADSVTRGAIASLGINYYEHGKQSGKMVARILRGEKVGELAVQGTDQLELIVNKKAAQEQGIVLSDDLLSRATKIIE
ncbi:ABC transporter substrate-binding protein [Thorsellia anophelis]|uniref:Putative ABC transport system substrate-binding protein n=1 Tax=Thorsellia anophelis DSM 18579 TaxID=1123402 RepID=A0A1I0CTR1_9GAMM|nr:ABC transporter substrate-binding protein [Thorsellia anophelis]SET23078.1 putative ABC transport system substrate-binding protein [Thorsellia anophelis DSM 18579]